MARHVDVVRNDWEAGVQRAVAAVHFDGIFHIKDADEVTTAKVQRVLDRVSITAPDPLLLFSQMMTGTMLFATEPHEMLACPFRSSDQIPMERYESFDAALAALG
jgi:hypothetical protein